MNEATNKPPAWFWILSGILFLWNLFGLAVFGMFMSMMGNQEALEAAKMNPEQIALIKSTPAWVNVAFGVAVVSGALGCLLLLLRSKFAIPLFVLSLVGVIAQNVYVYFLSNSIELMGVGASPFVILVAVGVVPFAVFCAKKGWLR